MTGNTVPSLSKMPSAKGWVFTVNNYKEHHCEAIMRMNIGDDVTGIVVGKEVGEQGTPHLQGAIGFSSRKTLKQLVEMFPGAHVEVMRGTWQQNVVYCTKQNNVLRREGTGPQQGERSDLETIYGLIKSGSSLDVIMDTFPSQYMRYSRAIEQCYDRVHRLDRKKKEPVQVVWIYGESGSGKSWITDEYAEDCLAEGKTVFTWEADGDWWDGYDGEEVIIMNEFKGDLSYTRMLKLCDVYTTKLRRRGRSPVLLKAKIIIINTLEDVKGTYPNIAFKNNCAELCRRVIEVEKQKDDGKKVKDFIV